MPNPSLTTKTKTSLTLSDSAKDIFRAVYQGDQDDKKEDEKEDVAG